MEKYEKPVMEIVELEAENVVTSSCDTNLPEMCVSE
jgi:hypothetical protein